MSYILGGGTDDKPSIPAWAWVFAASCGIIPFLTLGGAIPGAIGFGGAGGCMSTARNRSLPLGIRFVVCLAITIGCWGLTIAFFGGLARLARPSLPSVPSATIKPSAAIKPSATIGDYGRYSIGQNVRVVPDRKSSNGIVVLSDGAIRLLEQTDQIPCRVHERWGFRILCSDVPTDRRYKVRQETDHPPITRSDGVPRTKSVYEFTVPTGESPPPLCGWHFVKGYEHELVAGDWTIAVFIDDIEVARKVFHVRE